MKTSLDQSVDAIEERDFLETTRTIEKLAASDIREDRFFELLLQHIAAALRAPAAAVWLFSQNGMLTKFRDRGLEHTHLGQDTEADQIHIQQLLDVVQNGQAAIHPEDTGTRSRLQQRHVVLMAPIRHEDRPIGVLELFLTAEDSPQDSRLGDLEFVEEMTVYASRYLQWREEAGSAEKHLEFWTRFERAVQDLHSSLDPQVVAATATNEGRQLLACDRISVAMRRGGRFKVINISGQDRVNSRSNLVRSMGSMTTSIVGAGQTVTFTGEEDELPPQQVRELSDYLQQSESRLVKVIPLFPPERIDGQSAPKPQHRQRAFAALVIEQFSSGWLTPVVNDRTDLFANNVARALWNARSHQQIFLLPLWRLIGRCLATLQGRRLLKLLFFMLLVSGSIAAMTLIPAEYRVEGTGQLMPVVQRVIYAPWDGEVIEIHVASGEIVEANQVLVTLRNDELNTRILETDNKLAEKREHFTSIKAEVDLGSLRTSPDNATRLRGQMAQTQIEINGLAQRLAALQAQQRLLTVRAPIAGTVATFQLEQLLLNRPVSRGERLLEIMDESGEWHLELEVPEQRMGHLLDAQEEHGGESLSVEFVLATDPEATFSGTLRQMSTRTALSEKHGTAVAVNVELNTSQLRHRRIGSEVLGKISCGQRSLAYVLFGDVVEFVRRRVW